MYLPTYVTWELMQRFRTLRQVFLGYIWNKVNLLLCHSQLGWLEKLFGLTVWKQILVRKKKFGRKNISVWEFVGQNKFCSTKICGQKKILFRKIFVLKSFDWKTNLVGKIIWSEKNSGLRKILIRKSFWSEKNFRRKKILVWKNCNLRKILVGKILVGKKNWV